MRQHVVRREELAARPTKASYLGPVLEGHVKKELFLASDPLRGAKECRWFWSP